MSYALGRESWFDIKTALNYEVKIFSLSIADS